MDFLRQSFNLEPAFAPNCRSRLKEKRRDVFTWHACLDKHPYDHNQMLGPSFKQDEDSDYYLVAPASKVCWISSWANNTHPNSEAWHMAYRRRWYRSTGTASKQITRWRIHGTSGMTHPTCNYLGSHHGKNQWPNNPCTLKCANVFGILKSDGNGVGPKTCWRQEPEDLKIFTLHELIE